ncbi:MotA/TolQ/ExbB proton channel family protein [bacterium]|nr:MotA/TolQ/ExbB proton channel family protein [bacterium]
MGVLELYIKGGVFMHPILFCLIIGIAFVIERLISLTKSSTDIKKFMVSFNQTLREKGVDSAIELCQKTTGSASAVILAGLGKIKYGTKHVETAIENAASVEMAFLEKGLIYLNTVIAMAPMLGFTGTVWGMIEAFNAIAAAGDVSPSLVADGISQALITTLGGLVVAMIIQLCTNYFISKISSMIVEIEESSVEAVDALIDQGILKVD